MLWASVGCVALTELLGFSSHRKSGALTEGRHLEVWKEGKLCCLSPIRSGEDKTQGLWPTLFIDIFHTIPMSRISRNIFTTIIEATISNFWLHRRIILMYRSWTIKQNPSSWGLDMGMFQKLPTCPGQSTTTLSHQSFYRTILQILCKVSQHKGLDDQTWSAHISDLTRCISQLRLL